MSDHGNGNNKRSIDKIIEHMTADVQNSDGQYIQLGFTPPSTPGTQHSWAEYPGNNSNNGPLHHYLPHSPVVTTPDNAVFYSDMQVPYEIDIANHITKQNELLQQHNFYYAPPRPQLNMLGDNRELISTMLEVGGGNVVNVVYGSRTSNVNDGTLVGQQYHLITPEGHRETVPHALGGFVPYHQESLMESPTPNMLKEYGLFGTNDQQQNRSFQHSQQHYQQVQANNRGQLIENLVGNWVPNQSGTYSPFGCSDASLRPVPSTNQQTTQTVPDHMEMECENKGLGRGVRKTRIVAEVKPMRPSYSDVLTKSAPLPNNSSVVSKQNSHNSSLNNSKGDSSVSGKTKIGGVSKGSNKKNKNNALKRQHSSGSDEHNGNGISAPTKVIQSPLTSRKSTGSDSKHNSVSFHTLPRKWVSLDDLECDKQASKLEEEDVFDGGCSPKPAGGTRNGTGEAHASKKSSRSKSVQQDEKWDGSPLNNKTLNFVSISTATSPSCSNGNGKINGNGSGGGVNGVPAAGGSKRPIHINNNLGSSVWGQAKGGGGTTKNVKTMSEERKASSNSKESSKSGSSRSCGNSGRGGCVSGGGPGLSSGMQNGGGGGSGVMDKSAQGKRSQRGKKRTTNSPIAMVCQPMKQQAWRWAQMGLSLLVWFTLLLYDVLGMSSKLLAHMGLVTYARVRSWTNKVYRKMSATVCKVSLWPSNWWKRGKKQSAADGEDKLQNGIPAGLENNISLPSTGEEAMKRLLACKGKDPYSILGVTPNSTDDDIKKYYKRQAFLVHPDKNNQPGAEEAFKILVHAFELIGEPERRKAYDRRVAETQQVEQAWSELNDLLSQLHQKMEYAANTIRCTNCGKRHRRVSVDRPCYAARMCSQCKIHHAAREGDIWAESSMLGFLWHYYACMDGAVYDITEWAACQADNLRHLRANTHAVQYRIVLGRQQAPPRHRGQESTSEPDLENFLNNLYSQSGSSGNGDSAGNRSDQARNRRKGKRKK